MTVNGALRFGIRRLKEHRCAGADPVRDAELLLAYVMRISKEAIAREPERRVPLFARLRYGRLLRRRAEHAPIAHLTGWVWFAGRHFRASRHALIPRPATESLLHAALSAAPDARRIIDVGTGTGVIAVTCALARPEAEVFATDISRKALRAARRNARLHGVADRVTCSRDDLIGRLRRGLTTDTPSLIIANLPYLPHPDRDTLDPDVTRYEPSVALFGGTDGLDPSRRLLDQLATWPERPAITMAMELLPAQCGPLIRYAEKKIPGLAARTVRNASGTPIGVIVTVR